MERQREFKCTFRTDVNQTPGDHVLIERMVPSIEAPKRTVYECRCGLVVTIPDIIVRGARPPRIKVKVLTES